MYSYYRVYTYSPSTSSVHSLSALVIMMVFWLFYQSDFFPHHHIITCISYELITITRALIIEIMKNKSHSYTLYVIQATVIQYDSYIELSHDQAYHSHIPEILYNATYHNYQ